MAENKYTGEDAREALKKILNLKREDESSYTQKEPSDDEIRENVTHVPEDVLDTSIGVREGILKSINPKASNGFYYEVYFPGSNTSVYARLTYGLGFGYTPNGKWEGDIYRDTEKVVVKLQAIKDTLQWIIVGVEEEPVIVPGASTITRENSQVITHPDHVIIKNEDTVAKVNNEWMYINDKKICVEPCGGNEIVLWYSADRSITVSCEKGMYTYDLNNREVINSIRLDGVILIGPATFADNPFYALQEDRLLDIDMDYGVVNNYKRYENRTLKFFTPIFAEYLVDKENNIYMQKKWFSPNASPTYENLNLNDIIEVIDEPTLLLFIIIDKNKVNYYRKVNDYTLELIFSINIEENINSVYYNYYTGKIVLATDNSLITIQWSLNPEEGTFSIEPYIDKIIPISNPKICRSAHYLNRFYGVASELCILYSGQTVYHLDTNDTLIELVTFDNEVKDIMVISDHYGDIDFLTFYGVRENYIDVIMYCGNFELITIEEIINLAVKEKFTVEFPCPIISYSIKWTGASYG